VNERLRFINIQQHAHLKLIDRTEGVIKPDSTWYMFLSTDADILYSWPTTVPAWTSTRIQIKAQRIKSKSISKARCLDEKKVNKQYSSDACMADCESRSYKEESLNCQIYWMSTKERGRLPNFYCNQLDTPTLPGFLTEKAIGINAQYAKACEKECPPECDRMTYEGTVKATAEIPTGEEQKSLNNWNKTETLFYIYHDAVISGGIITYNEASSYSFIELVNNIGGTFGLFVGGTVLTLAQLLLFCCSYHIEKRKEKLGDLAAK